MSQSGWIGVDLDGTLAQYEKFEGPEIIGEPIPLMVNRVKGWLAEGREVRILTARVYCMPEPGVYNPSYMEWHRQQDESSRAYFAIKAWCLKHIGQELPVTCQKDYHMYQLWDDRAIQVIPNTGLRADGQED